MFIDCTRDFQTISGERFSYFPAEYPSTRSLFRLLLFHEQLAVSRLLGYQQFIRIILPRQIHNDISVLFLNIPILRITRHIGFLRILLCFLFYTLIDRKVKFKSIMIEQPPFTISQGSCIPGPFGSSNRIKNGIDICYHIFITVLDFLSVASPNFCVIQE